MKTVEKVEGAHRQRGEKRRQGGYGGNRSALGGTFSKPTVLTDVATDMVITKEETFGPVALYRFKADDEVAKMIDDAELDLATPE
jgi:succinate-semialdehyde dehydrogenase/glutarate-semialdehyde dehydrogenase